jgi:hypothetical protein
MIDLDDLKDLFDDLGFDEPDHDQFNEMLEIFTDDFVTNPFKVDGKQVKVIMSPTWNREFIGHPETFVHLITRESKFKGKKERQFDKWRANRIHWIKPILLNKNNARIKYFEYLDEKGYMKHHFWFEEKNFMVVLKPISNELLVVTAFCVDKLEIPTYKRRYNEYRGL